MSKRSEHPTSEDHPELKHPSVKVAKKIDSPDTPYDRLVGAIDTQKKDLKVTGVAHWFRSKDLRIQDNKGLYNASKLAKEEGKPLITFYLYCAKEFEWHGTSPARTDFILRALEQMQKDLKSMNIPLVILDAAEREDKLPEVHRFVQDNKISHLFANYEYEVDELRRDIALLHAFDDDVQVSLYHDQTIMEPGSMLTSAGKPQKVFTPYHGHWLDIVKGDGSLLDTVPDPEANDKSATKSLSKLFGTSVPTAPETKQFSSMDDQKRVRSLWPAGHAAGIERLNDFIKSKISDYAATRSNPAADSTSRLSAYFASGQISVREALSALRDHNDGSSDFTPNGSSQGVASWVREICFRELYRQTTAMVPHSAMNLPQNLKMDNVDWEEDEEGWERWCKGTTGVPFVDAGMRQLNTEAYMHNRLRMNTSSWLTHNLLIDYRRGERYFAETLIDWDLSNNTQGWEPSYPTIFNPLSQAERNDPHGDYIRKWVPELKDVKGKAIFAPHERLSKEEFEKLGYPQPYVDFAETKQRAMERFKTGMKEADV